MRCFWARVWRLGGGTPLLLIGFGKLGGFCTHERIRGFFGLGGTPPLPAVRTGSGEAPQNVVFCSANPRYNHYYGIAIGSGQHSDFVIGKFSFLILLGGFFFSVLLRFCFKQRYNVQRLIKCRWMPVCSRMSLGSQYVTFRVQEKGLYLKQSGLNGESRKRGYFFSIKALDPLQIHNGYNHGMGAFE